MAREALDGYKRDHRCSDGEAKRRIEERYEGMPLTKLVDLYNYKTMAQREMKLSVLPSFVSNPLKQLKTL